MNVTLFLKARRTWLFESPCQSEIIVAPDALLLLKWEEWLEEWMGRGIPKSLEKVFFSGVPQTKVEGREGNNLQVP